MYTEFFGLNERPFSIAPDPQYLYMSSRHKEAMAHLSYGLLQGGCFIVLTGEVGTGKTTLCRNLLQELPDNVDVALILNANINETELLQTLCDELKIPYAGETSQKKLLDLINEYLLAAYAENRHTVLIIDEAQLLGRDVLEQIRLLTNLETTKQKLLQIILIGQPELNEILSRNDLRQLAQRVTARYHLGALRRNEIEDYINFRLGVAGCRQPLFSKQALTQLHLLTGGIPRKINVLADHSLLSAYSKSQQIVNAQAVKVAAREVFIAAQQETDRPAAWAVSLRKWWLPATLLLLLNIGLWWWFTAQKSAPPIAAVAPANQMVQEQVTPPGSTDATQTRSMLAGSQGSADATSSVQSNAAPAPVVEPGIPPATELESKVQIRDDLQTAIVVQADNSVEEKPGAPASGPADSELVIPPQQQAGGTVEAAQSSTSAPIPSEPNPVESTTVEAPVAGSTEADVPATGSETAGQPLITITSVADKPGTMVVADEFLSVDEVEPAPLSTRLGDILETSADLTGRIAAFRTLAALWNQSLPEQFLSPACVVVAQQDLRCQGVSDWAQLERYNRPAILVLSHDDQLHRIVLKSIDGSEIVAMIGGREYELRLSELQRHWTGRGVIFWRPGESGANFYKMGDESVAMPALRERLNQAFEIVRLPLLASVELQQFDLDMSQKVFAMQSRFSIIADSKIGNETYILINEILRSEAIPVLQNRMP